MENQASLASYWQKVLMKTEIELFRIFNKKSMNRGIDRTYVDDFRLIDLVSRTVGFCFYNCPKYNV